MPVRGGVNSVWIICSGEISRLRHQDIILGCMRQLKSIGKKSAANKDEMIVRLLMERKVKRGKVEAINLVNTILDFTTTELIAQQCIIDSIVCIWN